jgi:toxin ParE1/3/4
MKRVEVHPEAKTEEKQAFDRYWNESQTAASGFWDELKDAYNTLRKSPRIGSPYLRGTRRILLHRYPYSVVFREVPEMIQVIAVAHAKRRPGYWAKRLKQ